MLALPLNSHSALCTTHWFRICTMHCLRTCTVHSALAQNLRYALPLSRLHFRLHIVASSLHTCHLSRSCAPCPWSQYRFDIEFFFVEFLHFIFLGKCQIRGIVLCLQELSTALFSYSHQVLLRLSCFLTLQQSKKFATQPKSLSWVVLLQFDVDCFCTLRNPAKDLLVIGMMAS